MLLGLILLKEANTLTALRYQESVPTLSLTLKYPWPLKELRAARRSLIVRALSPACKAWRFPWWSSTAGGRGRRTVICTELSWNRSPILCYLKQRWGIETMFKTLKDPFGFGDCRCWRERSPARWVKLGLLAYVLAGLTR